MKELSVDEFMSKRVVGMILRVYANREEDIPKRIAMVREAVERGRAVAIRHKRLIKKIDILVWADKRYPESDCGKTTETLKKIFKNENEDLSITEVTDADIFCGILNQGIYRQIRYAHADYTTIVSSEAFSYMTNETFESMVEAACKGARAIGVAINELTQSILEGRICNSFSMWHNESLATVNMFDIRSAKPIERPGIFYLKGWSQEKDEYVYYHLAGVEEITALVRMTDNFGSCIAPVIPSGPGVHQYLIPDPAKDKEGWDRYVAKIATKTNRQIVYLAYEGCDISSLKGGVMPEYRKF
jgi:hypothetical protein